MAFSRLASRRVDPRVAQVIGGNLYLTGDWIDNGFLNIGCVESTVVAGFTASRAISGYPERIFYLDK